MFGLILDILAFLKWGLMSCQICIGYFQEYIMYSHGSIDWRDPAMFWDHHKIEGSVRIMQCQVLLCGHR